MTSFCVEIEAVFPDTDAVHELSEHKTAYHSEHIQAPYFPTGWSAQADSSIDLRNPDDYLTAEIISPPLGWPSGMQSVINACEALRQLDARVNPSCGLHVHVGLPDATLGEIDRIKALATRYEFALYGASGAFIASRMASEHGRHYCRTSLHPLVGDNHEDRYRGLNLTRLNTMSPRRRTVEFRMFQASTITHRVIGAVALAVAIVREAMSVGDEPLTEVTRIASPVAAMQELLTGPIWARVWPRVPDVEEVERTLYRQARKAERMLGVV
jgi:hypothetical protein